MSNLTEFLHKLVDHVGASSLHGDVDAIEDDTAPKAEDTGEEESSNATE